MILATEQHPMSVNGKVNDYLLMAIDRGNSGSKIAVSVNRKPMEPFKIPSVIREVLTDGVINIDGKAYVCGESAISMKVGSLSTPLQEGDKVKNLGVVIAQVIQRISEEQTLSSDLDIKLVVSSPFSTAALKKEIENEVKPLTLGFMVKGQSYKLNIVGVETRFEGAVLLEAVREFNAVIDVGFGTLLAAYRTQSGRVHLVPVMAGDMGGVNLVLKGLIADEAFLKQVKASGATAPPSLERLSAKLSEGIIKLRDIDLKPLLKTHLKVLKERIENAINAVVTEIRYSEEDAPQPKIALVGGGAALLKSVLSEKELEAWSKKYSVELFTQPDYQTAMTMHQIAHTDGGAN